jgi:hypothetical protein
MQDMSIRPAPAVLQKSLMGLFCIYAVSQLISAIIALRVLIVIPLVAAIVQASLCAYLWLCSRGAGAGLERKRTVSCTVDRLLVNDDI